MFRTDLLALGTEFTGSYNKSQQDAPFLKFILIKKLYMFQTDLLERSGWNTLTSLAESQHN